MAVLTILSFVLDFSTLGEIFLVSTLFTAVIFIIIESSSKNLAEIKRIRELKSQKHQEIVTPKKSLPVYFPIGGSFAFFVGSLAAIFVIILIMAGLLYFKFSINVFKVFSVPVVLGIIFAIILYIDLMPRKILYLLKDNENVVQYNDNMNLFNTFIENYEDKANDTNLLFYLNSSLCSDNGYFIDNKCEKIILDNNIEFMSCFTKERVDSYSNDSTTILFHNLIFVATRYRADKDINLLLSNNFKNHIDKENIYISNYSNLPPFIYENEDSKDVCSKIDKICSDFFSKTRSKYAFTIKDGYIGLLLNHARFGKINRIFNKKRTIILANEAIAELSAFINEINAVLE